MKIDEAAKHYSVNAQIEPLKLEDFTERQEGEIYLSQEGHLRLFYRSEGFSAKPQSKSYLNHSYRDLITGELGIEEETGNEDIFKIKKYHLVTEGELPWVIHFANKEILKRIIESTRVPEKITSVDLNIDDLNRIAKGN